jgi:hypothetical protein
MPASVGSKLSEAQTTDRAGHAEPPERAVIAFGPLFTAGVGLLVYGIFRRRPLALAAGIGAIWLDQRSELGRALKERVRAGTNTLVLEQKPGDQTRSGSGISA